jgi:hypothetical protein
MILGEGMVVTAAGVIAGLGVGRTHAGAAALRRQSVRSADLRRRRPARGWCGRRHLLPGRSAGAANRPAGAASGGMKSVASRKCTGSE